MILKKKKRTCTQKLLEIRFDDKLTWTTHIDHLCSTISSKISLLRQLSGYVSIDVQKMRYQGYNFYFLLLMDP